MPSNFRAAWRYALAIRFVAAALFLSLALQVPFGNPFWLFFPIAVIMGTWYGGRGPGWVAVALSTLAVLYYFIPPLRSFAIKPRDIPFLFDISEPLSDRRCAHPSPARLLRVVRGRVQSDFQT
jgi:K+-sensing histidine kinase KdpD